MFRNYFKTAYRSLLHNKAYALINVIGLAVGIASCLLVFLVIQFERSFDTFHTKRDQIYRVVTAARTPEGIAYNSGVPVPVAEALRKDFPYLKKVGAVVRGNDLITVTDKSGGAPKKFNEKNGIYFAEPSVFEILDFKWLQGNPSKALSGINTVVLTKSIAEKYFGDWKQATGKTITQENKRTLMVTGVLDDIPVNSDFPFQVVISYKTFLDGNPDKDDWETTIGSHYCFVLLPTGMRETHFNRLLLDFVKRHKPADYVSEELVLHPFREMHYDSRYGNYRWHVFSPEMAMALTLIGVLLLIIACVNFINLATAQAVNRSREVGVRKALGSRRGQLVLQFLSETALITMAAVLLAMVMAWIGLPFVNQLLGVSVSLHVISPVAVLLFLAGIMIAVTLLSGFYPAVVLSGFNPVTALKNRITASMVGGIPLRRGLVVLQFAVAQVLIVGMLVVVGQMDYFRNTSMGFDKTSILTIPVISDSVNMHKMDYLRNRLMQVPGVNNISLSHSTPAGTNVWTSDFRFDGASKPAPFNAVLKWADASYFQTYNLVLVAGRAYTNNDSMRGFVVNETLVKKLGIRDPQAIIGRKLDFWDGERVGPVVGVIKDFHSLSLHQAIQPIVMAAYKENYNVAGLKIQPERTEAVLKEVERIWKETYPDYLYGYGFLDQTLSNFYQQENRLSSLYRLFAGIAIFISCLGLYGLISYMVVQRSKEVGIRKVLGASAANIVFLLSSEFTWLIMIAFAIAAPVAWYLMHRWLENFAFHMNFGIGIFLLTILGSLCIAWLTVGLRTVKAALANPVEILKAD